MKQLSFILILAVAVLFGCNDDKNRLTSPRYSESDVIMPLAVGNTWSGTVRISIDDIETVHPWSWFISGETRIGRETWYWVSTTLDNDTTWNDWMATNRDDGLWRSSGNSDIDIYARYPGSYLDTSGWRCQITSTDTTCSTPAGDFSCYRYCFVISFDQGIILDERHYAVGVGPVHRRLVDVWKGCSRVETYVLEQFSSAAPEGQ